MRKQTKLVAVLSAAALLAIGASMTSFAAWQKSDDGTWQYFDRDGEMVSGEWQKDGAKWFYLDDDGNMLTDSWVEDEYYVGDDGAMIVNDWKKTIADEDVDDPEEDGDSWYYFGSKGKKIASDSKKIAGKTYYFDSDGRMEDGWWDSGSAVYYLGDEDEGWRSQGQWLWLSHPEDEDGISTTGCGDSCTVCDDEGWYYFGSDGQLFKDAKKKKVNGKYYFFNAHGQMLYEWVDGTPMKAGTPSNATSDENATPGSATIDNMIYTNVVEEGWRADGWYEIDGSNSVNTKNDTDWYYFKDGVAKHAVTADIIAGVVDDTSPVVRARIKVLGKYFCFNENGQMQTGLQYVPAGSARGFYYFDENGYMKTGKVSNVEEENDTFSYNFISKTGSNGKGYTGANKDGYLYFNGKRLEADDDYKLYYVSNAVYLVNNKGKIQKSTSKKYDIENSGTEVLVTYTSTNGNKVNTVDGSAVATTDAAGTITAVDPSVAMPKIELYGSNTSTGIANEYTYDPTTSFAEGWK